MLSRRVFMKNGGLALLSLGFAPAFLARNPNGRIPALVDGELTLSDDAAIVLHLVDQHPDAGLALRSVWFESVARPASGREFCHPGMAADCPWRS